MPLLLAVTLAAAVQPACSWDNPGHNPYTGAAAAAIDHYRDIPDKVRLTLKRRLEEGQADDQVDITRDRISGKHQYAPAIRDMHFGKSSLCASVTRSKWAENRSEPGAVYCVDQHCILVPRICGNVSRISRTGNAASAASEQDTAHASVELFDATAEQQFAALSEVDLGLEDAPLRDDFSTAFMSPEGIEGAMRRAAADRRYKAMAGLLGELSAEELLAAMGQDADALARRQGLAGGSGISLPISDAPAAPVPEADTWAMLAAGLGLVGWQARRRARKAAAQAAR
jgi:hypothetical protein